MAKYRETKNDEWIPTTHFTRSEKSSSSTDIVRLQIITNSGIGAVCGNVGIYPFVILQDVSLTSHLAFKVFSTLPLARGDFGVGINVGLYSEAYLLTISKIIRVRTNFDQCLFL